MKFLEFLLQKRIHSATFQAEKPEMWHHFAQLFEQMGEKSFDAQKKFYFNPLRAEFPLPAEEIARIEEAKKAAAAAKKITAKPIIPVVEKKEEPTGEPVKKVPPKMKPIIKKEPLLAEKEEDTPTILPENVEAPVKKVPPKMKPIMKKEPILAEKEAEETPTILPENIEAPVIKKVPPKMKPIMKKTPPPSE